jgi:predicted transcriptional regulator
MRKYRSKLEIIEGILITLSEKQVNKTRLMYATNLNYDLLKKYLFVLESNGFISRNGQKYVITNKGLTLLEK